MSMAGRVHWVIPSAPPVHASSPPWCMPCVRVAAAAVLRRYVSAAVRPPPSPSKYPAELQDRAPVAMLCALSQQEPSMKMTDARAVITGGASGLGNAVARHIVAAGGRACLLDV